MSTSPPSSCSSPTTSTCPSAGFAFAALGSDQFNRLRIGVGRAGTAASHVLATFAPGERDLATEMVAVGADAAELWLREGIEAAMNAFNGVELA
jgi:peptidyl-tRNA hydrolase, PTH1 family